VDLVASLLVNLGFVASGSGTQSHQILIFPGNQSYLLLDSHIRRRVMNQQLLCVVVGKYRDYSHWPCFESPVGIAATNGLPA
jgi:hypothetical protein